METPLKTQILPSYICAHQNFAIRLLNWLKSLFAKVSGFRGLFSGVFFDPENPIELPKSKNDKELKKFAVCEKVLTAEPDFWKAMRRSWINLIVEGIIKEYDSKVELARTFSRNYSDIMSNFTTDDQESDVTVVNLTVQFFTVKSIAHSLMSETDIFATLVRVFAKRLADHLAEFGGRNHESEFQTGVDPALSVLMMEEKAEYARFETVLTDLMYLLRVPFESGNFTDESRVKFMKGTEEFIDLLSEFQFADPHERMTGAHVEYESIEWEFVGKMIASLASITSMIHKWCSRDKGLLIGVTNQVVKKINQTEGNLVPVNIRLETFNESFPITQKDVLSGPVSINAPLQRFLSGLLPSFNAFNEEMARNYARRLQSMCDVFHLADPVITAVAAVSTIVAGFWRMNGTPAAGQAFLYNNFHLCPSLKRHDLILLQSTLCAIDEPGRITLALLERSETIIELQ